jgi:hypothetical protein
MSFQTKAEQGPNLALPFRFHYSLMLPQSVAIPQLQDGLVFQQSSHLCGLR